ncbi:hypothetical protein PGTUg99_014100 [Puccinia graminis f. sp. tritici]|uniref:Uncharacterized protein n=1 Tax=Puccinia graminis f. sp. tritici TaxID=56615 RepID=A0A5B0NA61_PUCGR|nr:hypothetical protein PGTUg99_014100 [Puccinia graminis f. sp. tritici]
MLKSLFRTVTERSHLPANLNAAAVTATALQTVSQNRLEDTNPPCFVFRWTRVHMGNVGPPIPSEFPPNGSENCLEDGGFVLPGPSSINVEGPFQKGTSHEQLCHRPENCSVTVPIGSIAP